MEKAVMANEVKKLKSELYIKLSVIKLFGTQTYSKIMNFQILKRLNSVFLIGIN